MDALTVWMFAGMMVMAAAIGWLAWLIFDLRGRCRRLRARCHVLARKEAISARTASRAYRKYRKMEEIVNRHTVALEDMLPIVNRLST